MRCHFLVSAGEELVHSAACLAPGLFELRGGFVDDR